ncbi:hypothetical protein OP864_10460 [Saprospira grandis]|nr:hypothetical protein [Saprospira grandis]WBM73420.1 hypothetical protein OP864_10460 [Saprospira grandis]
MFWGCPSLWLGRAIAQLAGLLGPAAAKPLWSAAFGGPATAPQPAGLRPFLVLFSKICGQPPRGIP